MRRNGVYPNDSEETESLRRDGVHPNDSEETESLRRDGVHPNDSEETESLRRDGVHPNPRSSIPWPLFAEVLCIFRVSEQFDGNCQHSRQHQCPQHLDGIESSKIGGY